MQNRNILQTNLKGMSSRLPTDLQFKAPGGSVGAHRSFTTFGEQPNVVGWDFAAVLERVTKRAACAGTRL